MQFQYNQQPAYLSWYTQQILTVSVDKPYGKEVLCRGFLKDSQTPIPMPELLNYLYSNPDLLLKMTCQQIKDFTNEICCDIGTPRIWVNIAGQLIADDRLFQALWHSTLVKIPDQQRRCLVLEVCEDDMNNHTIMERVVFLQDNGFAVAMDDFGSGHSNLQRLSQVRFDIIKLDLGLIVGAPDDLWQASFYREIVSLCSSQGCLVVAEGVETHSQSDFVRWAGVDLIQGFFYSKPSATEEQPSCSEVTL